MRKIRCEKIRRRLGPYFDGELSGRKRDRVEAHLRDCRSCRGEVERLRRIGALIREGVESSAAAESADLDGLLRSIRGEIGRSVERPARAKGFRGARFRGMRILVPSAVAMLLIGVLIFTIYKPRAPVIKSVYPNECIIDSIESGSGTVMIFQTHGSRITVIWISGGTEPDREAAGLWSVRSWV